MEIVDLLVLGVFLYVFLRGLRGGTTQRKPPAGTRGELPEDGAEPGSGRGGAAGPGGRGERPAGAGTATAERQEGPASLIDVLRSWETEQRRKEAERRGGPATGEGHRAPGRHAPERGTARTGRSDARTRPQDARRRRELAERRRRELERRRQEERLEAERLERERELEERRRALAERSRPLEEWGADTEVVSLEAEPPAPFSWDERSELDSAEADAGLDAGLEAARARVRRGADEMPVSHLPRARRPGARGRPGRIYEEEVGEGLPDDRIAVRPDRGSGARRRGRGRNPFAALEARAPLHRAILYGEVLGPPRGTRPHDLPASEG